MICPLCQSSGFRVVFEYTEPPEGEIRFRFSAGSEYSRRIIACETCAHFLSVHEMDMSGMYSEEYVSSTYGQSDGIRKTFEKILGLPPEQSDNTGRVSRIVSFAAQFFGAARKPTLMDVGSGLCVFPYRMKQAGWDCTALDPDIRNAEHAQKVAGVTAVCADFMQYHSGSYDVITFNKVLEHVADPIAMLRKSARHLNPGGFVYIELPDGEAAASEGPGREEFFIDHHHIFSASSFSLLVQRAGLRLMVLERIREPSTKFTLRGFTIA